MKQSIILAGRCRCGDLVTNLQSCGFAQPVPNHDHDVTLQQHLPSALPERLRRHYSVLIENGGTINQVTLLPKDILWGLADDFAIVQLLVRLQISVDVSR